MTERDDFLPERREAGAVERFRQTCEWGLTDDDLEFILELGDFEAALNYVYGRLLEEGNDPEEVLAELGIVEPKDETE